MAVARPAAGKGPREELRAALARVYPFLSFEAIGVDGREADLVPCRLTTRCNQSCPFCQAVAAGSEPDPPAESIRRALARVARCLAGAKLVLTGGEPTLRQDLVGLVEHALALEGIATVEVQTNAVAIGRSPELFPFPRSSRLRFLVALHGGSPEVYDATTGSRGLLPLALEGIRQLSAQGHGVELNCVVTGRNVDHLAEVAETAAACGTGSGAPAVHFSVMGIPEHRDASRLLVRYDEMLRAIDAARERGNVLGVRVTAALEAGHAAVPECLLPDASRGERERSGGYRHERGLSDGALVRWWTRDGPRCAGCEASRRCLGLPRAYVERFGWEGVEPVAGGEDR